MGFPVRSVKYFITCLYLPSNSFALLCRRNLSYSSLYLVNHEAEEKCNCEYQELSVTPTILSFTNNSHRIIRVDTERITWGSDAETRDCQTRRARRTWLPESRVDADSRSVSPKAGIILPGLVVKTTEFLGRWSIGHRSSPASNPARNIDRNVHGALSQSCIRVACLATQFRKTINICLCRYEPLTTL